MQLIWKRRQVDADRVSIILASLYWFDSDRVQKFFGQKSS